MTVGRIDEHPCLSRRTCRTVEDARACIRAARPDTPQDGGTYGVATRRHTYMGYGGTPEYVQVLQEVVVALVMVVMVVKVETMHLALGAVHTAIQQIH